MSDVNEPAVIGIKESVLIEEWEGDDPSSGVRVVHESAAWFDAKGNEITDEETIRKLEENSHGTDNGSSR